MSTNIEARMDALARRDRVLAVVLTVLMWLVLLFVFIVASAVAPHPAISVVALLSALVLGAFNTASTVGMLRRYAAHKDFIYRQDVLNLDRAREQQAGEGR